MAKKTILEPAGDMVLVADQLRDNNIGDLCLPDNIRQQDMVYGTVIFVGPLACETHPRDVVSYGPYAGKTVIFNGVELRLLKQGQIELYLRQVESDESENETSNII